MRVCHSEIRERGESERVENKMKKTGREYVFISAKLSISFNNFT